MTKEQFLFMRSCIYADLEREIQLAYASHQPEYVSFVESHGVRPGGGNFLAALGLLCYIETAGKLIPGFENKSCRDRFNEFLSRMGEPYVNLLKEVNAYDVFRCGMAHEYFMKSSEWQAVDMSLEASCGLMIVEERYVVVVGKLFVDFQRAFESLGLELGFLERGQTPSSEITP